MKLSELQPLIDMAVASKWGDSEVVARFGDTYYSVSDFNPSNAEGTANHCEIVMEARVPTPCLPECHPLQGDPRMTYHAEGCLHGSEDKRVAKWTVRPISAFLRDIEEVCKRHNISIGHEDGHGSFLILDYDDPRSYFGDQFATRDERKKAR